MYGSNRTVAPPFGAVVIVGGRGGSCQEVGGGSGSNIKCIK